MRRPIACSLDEPAARSQLADWQSMFAASVVGAEREDATTVRVRLRPETDVAGLVALARKEAACCPFFRFAIEVDSDGLAFVVSVPADAETILDSFATLCTP
jgi:hypothetical protein